MGILLSIKINDALFLFYLLLKDKVMQRLNTVSCCCCCCCCFFFVRLCPILLSSRILVCAFVCFLLNREVLCKI